MVSPIANFSAANHIHRPAFSVSRFSLNKFHSTSLRPFEFVSKPTKFWKVSGIGSAHKLPLFGQRLRLRLGLCPLPAISSTYKNPLGHLFRFWFAKGANDIVVSQLVICLVISSLTSEAKGSRSPLSATPR